MKKFYSLCTAALLASGSAFAAGWTAPSLQQVQTINGDNVQEYYLKNVATDSWFMAGNSWWTHAVVAGPGSSTPQATSPYGFKMRFADKGNGTYTWQNYSNDAKYSGVANNWHYVFSDDGSSVYTDNNTKNHIWAFTYQSDGYWQISKDGSILGVAEEATSDEGGNRGAGKGTGDYSVILNTTHAIQWELWSFIGNEEEYNAYLSLEDLKKEYEAKGYNTSGYSAGEQQNTATHAAEIKQTMTQMAADYKEWAITNGVYPISFTTSMQNPECAGTKGQAVKGWTTEGAGNMPYAGGAFFENWIASAASANFNYYQKVTGLPAGKYVITGDVAYAKAATDDEVGVYGISGGVEVVGGAKTGVADDVYATCTTPEIQVTDGELIIGIKTLKTQSVSWTRARNFTLTLVGGVSSDEFVQALKDAVDDAKKIDGQMNSAVAAQLSNAIKANESATYSTTEQYNAAIKTVNEAASAANASIKNYQDLQAALAVSDVLDAAGKAAFNNEAAIKDLVASYNNGSFEAITAEDKAAISAAMIVGTKAQTSKGTVMTALIVNPTIDGINGWSFDFPNGGNGPLKPSGDAIEYWAGNAKPDRFSGAFDIWQTIDGLKPGVYEVSAQAYNSLNGVGGATFTEACVVYGKTATSEGQGVVNIEGQDFNTYSAQVVVSEGEALTIGVKSIASMGAQWFVADNFTLKYIGEADLSVYKANYAAAKAKITEELLASPMNADILKDLNAFKNATAPTTKEALVAATTAIKTKVAEAEKSAKFYTAVGDALTLDEVKALDAAGQASFEAVAVPYAQAFKDGKLDETVDYVTIIKDAYIAAVKAQGAGADMTALMPNVWELKGMNNYPKLNVNEHYETFAYVGDALYQKIEGLKPGVYSVTFRAAASATLNGRDIKDGRAADASEMASVVFANDAESGIEVVDRLDVADNEFATFTVEGEVGADGILKYGIKNNDKAGNWFLAKEVKLTYLGEPAPTYAITISATDGGTVMGESGSYKEGDKIALSAMAAPGYEFDGWYAGTDLLSKDAAYSYTVGTAAADIQAKFTKVPTYNIVFSASEGGSVSSKSGEYTSGTKVTVLATAADGYNFVGWYDGATLIESASKLVYTTGKADANIVAKFEVVTYNVAVSATEGGRVSSTGGAYRQGSNVSLRATVDAGYEFEGWFVNDVKVSENTKLSYIVGTADATIVAKFQKQVVNYTVAVSAGEGGGTVTGAGEFAENSTVTIEAIPDEGYDFVGWYNGSELITNSAVYSFQIRNNASFAAKFEKQAPATEDVDIAINSFGYGTFSSAKNVDFSESGVAAYVASACNGTKINLKKVAKLPAGEGALIVAKTGSYKAVATAEEFDEVGTNFFVAGSGNTISAVGDFNYLNCILTVDAATKTKVGFYPLGEGQTVVVPAGKAYLSAPLEMIGSLSSVILEFDEDITAADEISVDLATGEVFTTVGGVRSNKAQKGINITADGKKVIRK